MEVQPPTHSWAVLDQVAQGLVQSQILVIFAVWCRGCGEKLDLQYGFEMLAEKIPELSGVQGKLITVTTVRKS